MASSMKLFAGANTAEGFYSCFSSIFSNRDVVLYIKGAPGTGKNGLMRKVSDAMTASGETVYEYYCSSDPDSLDGVAGEPLNAAIFDSTPPHAYEPTLPSARDIYINLADFVDERALRALRPRIEALQAGMGALYARAYDYFAAADRVRGAEKPVERAEANAEICDMPFTKDADESREGLVKYAFLCAYTCAGFVDFSESVSADRVISIPARFGFGITPLIKRLSEARASGGLDTLVFLDPIAPKRFRGAYLPDSRAFITVIEHGSGSDRDMFSALTEKARMALAEAKAMHDEIEKCYTPHTDFSNMNQIEARVMSAIFQKG